MQRYWQLTKLQKALHPTKPTILIEYQKKAKDAIITEALSSVKHQAAERGHKRARLIGRGIQPTDPLDPEAALGGSSHPGMTRR